MLYLDALDAAVAQRKDVPRDVSAGLGRTANALDMVNDHARYFGLGVDYRTDDKPRAVRKLKAKAGAR